MAQRQVDVEQAIESPSVEFLEVHTDWRDVAHEMFAFDAAGDMAWTGLRHDQ